MTNSTETTNGAAAAGRLALNRPGAQTGAGPSNGARQSGEEHSIGQAAELAQSRLAAQKNTREKAPAVALIAEQTNLLALNAAIEAALAGNIRRNAADVLKRTKRSLKAAEEAGSACQEARKLIQQQSSAFGEMSDAAR
ncbi:MAG: hypothetical protein NTY38_04300 [Acidobacteria bacterium]|nr:hypothetical protein [Acidobacteriota bacterium]